MINLSIILPSIRSHKLVDHFQSILGSCKNYSFELIVCSPYKIPKELLEKENVHYIQDWGNPVRCQCLCAVKATGKYLTWSSDDSLFFPNSLDIAISELEKMGENEKNVVAIKYREGTGENMEKDDYYKLKLAYPNCKYIDDSWVIFNAAIMHTDYYKELGGFDARFETTAVSHADLAARAQIDKAAVKLLNLNLLYCEHMPGETFDHGPIHRGGLYNDHPLYREIYNNSSCLNRVRIPLTNYLDVPSVWKERFPDKNAN